MTDQNLTPIEPKTGEQTPNEEFAAEPFIPPGFLLLIAALGFIVALVVLFTQTTFGVVGFGGLAFGILALIAWVLLAPGAARSAFTGRAARFGGTSILVTLVLFLAMVGIYTVVRDVGVRIDLTERNEFSLTDESREAITSIGADPTLPAVRILAFYGAGQAAQRDRSTALLDDYVANSAGKISYEFIDPDRSPQQLTLYGARPGQVVVAAVGADGALDVPNAELVPAFDQQGLTNAVLKVSSQGDFVAYLLTVRDNITAEMTTLRGVFVDQLDWTFEERSLIDFTLPNAERTLNDPALDGEVMVIPGGSAALAPEELEILQNYVNNGGDLIVFASTQLNEDNESLAIDPALNDYLQSSFGLRFNNDVVLDLEDAFQSPVFPVARNFNPQEYITSALPSQQNVMVFAAPLSISVSPEAPAGVTVSTLVSTGDTSFATTDFTRLLDPAQTEPLAQAEGDTQGPFVMAASAENTTTGARIVLFSSTSVVSDQFVNLGVDNFDVGLNAFVWATNFDAFFQTITIAQEQLPQDAPITATTEQVGTISFITILLLPFGVLAIGAWVWYSNRERARA